MAGSRSSFCCWSRGGAALLLLEEGVAVASSTGRRHLAGGGRGINPLSGCLDDLYLEQVLVKRVLGVILRKLVLGCCFVKTGLFGLTTDLYCRSI